MVVKTVEIQLYIFKVLLHRPQILSPDIVSSLLVLFAISLILSAISEIFQSNLTFRISRKNVRIFPLSSPTIHKLFYNCNLQIKLRRLKHTLYYSALSIRWARGLTLKVLDLVENIAQFKI
jgi:hypothetical protein